MSNHFLSTRQRQDEWMDAPGVDPEELAGSLRYIRKVNRWLRYTSATLKHLEQFSHSWKPGEQITILDVATGSADIPLAISRWAERKGFNIWITGLDRHPTTARIAVEQTRSAELASKVKIIRGDALELPFADGSFDYAITNMFLHHLDEDAVVRVMAQMDRVARRGIIVADLLRNRRAYAWISFFTLLADPIARHDARVSVAQAFTPAEALALRDRANIRYTEYWPHFAHRFVLAGQKPLGIIEGQR